MEDVKDHSWNYKGKNVNVFSEISGLLKIENFYVITIQQDTQIELTSSCDWLKKVVLLISADEKLQKKSQSP